MFNPLVKVHKPSYNWHDLSYESKVSTNFGILNSVMCKHFFTGERVKVGVEHLLKFAPMLAPVFQRYDVRFDSFVVPDRLVFKDAYNFYKGGKDGVTDYPAPSIDMQLLYNLVALSEFYSSNKINSKTNKVNIFTGTLIDMLNLPTFDELLDFEVLKAAYPDYDTPFYADYLTLARHICFEILDCPILVTDKEMPFYVDDTEVSLTRQYHAILSILLCTPDTKISLLPFLQYQFIWSEYYRNQFVQDNSQCDLGIESADLDADIRSAYWLEPSVQAVLDYLDASPSIFETTGLPVSSESEDTYDFSLLLTPNCMTEYPTAIGYGAWGILNKERVVTHPWSSVTLDGIFPNGLPFYDLDVFEAGVSGYPVHWVVQAFSNAFGVKNCNFAKDYFTSASLDSQLGPVVRIPLGDLTPVFSGATSAGLQVAYAKNGQPIQVQGSQHMEGKLSVPEEQFGTIPELREASILQKVMEKLALAGNRPLEWFKVFFGAAPSDERLQRPQFLGRKKSYVSISEVTQTSMSVEESGQPLGDCAGVGRSINTYGLFDVQIDEPSYVFILMSVLPKQSYFQGIPYELSKIDRFDFLLPDFQSVGMRPINNRELFARSEDSVFGFTDRYNEYRCSFDEIHGEFRNSLDFWHSSRKFGSTPGLNDLFVAAKDADGMNRIFAVTDNLTAHLYALLHFNISAYRPLELYPHYSL